MATLKPEFRLLKKTSNMKKLISVFIIIILFAGSFYGQDRIFKFIKSGTDANIELTTSDSLGNLYIAGSFYNSFTYDGLTITGNSSGETQDSYILKVLPNGKAAYIKPIVNNVADESVYIEGIDVNDKGELAVILSAPNVAAVTIGKRSVSLAVNQDDRIVAKISRTGFLMWAKRVYVAGGSTNLVARDVKIDTAGNVYVTGSFNGQFAYFGSNKLEGFTNGYAKFFLAKFTTDGTADWATTCDVSSDLPGDTLGSIFAYRLELTEGNRIYIAGDYTGSRRFVFGASSLKNQGSSNAYLACYLNTGDFAWIKDYTGNGTVSPGDIKSDMQGNVVFSCFFKSDTFQANGNKYSSTDAYTLLISKYGQTGTFLWDTPVSTALSYVGSINDDSRIFIDNSSHVLVAGNYDQSTVNHFYVMKLNQSTGNTMFFKLTDNVGYVYYYDIKADRLGNIYITGSTYNTFVFNSYTVNAPTSYGTSFLIKMDNAGGHIFGYQKENLTIDNNLFFNFLEVDNYGNVMVLGDYSGTEIVLDKPVSTVDSYGIFIARYTPVAEISGKVLNFSGSPIDTGYVKLLGYAYQHRCPVSDSVQIQSDGTYLFNQVPLGSYILYGFPGNTDGLDYLATFYPSVGHWEDAEILNLNEQLTYNDIDILVPQKFELQGGGRIAGNLVEVDEDDIFKSTQNKPRAKSKASLAKSKLKSDYDIIATTITDIYGNFYFSNVEDGDYYVLIEEPGLPNISVHNVTITGNSYVSNVNYLMNEENIEAVGDPQTSNIQNFKGEDGIVIYPNPSYGKVNVVSADNVMILSYKVLSADGKILINENVFRQSGDITIDLQPGIYIVQVNTNTHSILKKLIVRN